MKTKSEKPKDAEGKKDSSYPVYDLAEALKIGEAVKELGGGRTPVSKNALAKKLDYNASGPSFFQRVGAAKSFGVVDGWGEYSLTQAGRDYFYPIAEGVKQAALIGFLQTPPLFKRITARYDGDTLPDNETLGNVMHMEGVNDSWKERVAATFVRSAQTAGAIDANGALSCSASPAGTFPTLEAAATRQQIQIASTRKEPPTGTKQFNFDFDGRTVSLTVSEGGLHPIQWQALNDYVQSLKPKEGKK